jgi:serine/threonine-protein kinase
LTKTTYALSLRAPIANEEERALFQRRLGLWGLVVFVLSFSFFVVANGVILILDPSRVREVLHDRSWRVDIATTFAAGALWLGLRRRTVSAEVLGLLDIVTGAGLSMGWGLMAFAGEIPLDQRPELIALLACSFTLPLRSAVIPSTPSRTALVGAMGLVPVVVMAKRFYEGSPAADAMRLAQERQWLPPATSTAIWSLLIIVASVVSSSIIYGLQREVRRAMQLGQYRLEEKIGAGGMGVVYRASHAMLRRPTAIKLLSGSAAHATQRFEREVQITASLTHPNTVAVFDYGRTPDGVFYYAMEYIQGISLEDLVFQYGPQPARRVAHVLLQMCGALAEAHAAGLVHRDIKPANVMLTERGGVHDVVKVLDFGLVKETVPSDLAKSDPSASQVNTIVGTPHYMAPETILDPARIDLRADLYAVGATAYFLLTGQHVFDGGNLVELCSQHLHEAPVTPSEKRSDVPAELERLVLDCLAKKPADRPRDAAMLAARIRACALGEWLPEEAAAWWSTHAGDERRDTGSESALGATIAVSLDGRAPVSGEGETRARGG